MDREKRCRVPTNKNKIRIPGAQKINPRKSK